MLFDEILILCLFEFNNLVFGFSEIRIDYLNVMLMFLFADHTYYTCKDAF
jgi:hypothetical protein